MSQPSDRDVVVRCLSGQKEAFTELVHRYQRPLLAQLRGRLRDSHAVEEAAQETLVRAYFLLSKLKDHQAFFPWLLAIANRVALEQVRARQRDRRRVELMPEDCPGKEAPDSNHDSLERAINRLPDRCREVILLRYFGNFSCTEMADRLGLDLGTITKALSRAYALLRESLADQVESMTAVRRSGHEL